MLKREKWSVGQCKKKIHIKTANVAHASTSASATADGWTEAVLHTLTFICHCCCCYFSVGIHHIKLVRVHFGYQKVDEWKRDPRCAVAASVENILMNHLEMERWHGVFSSFSGNPHFQLTNKQMYHQSHGYPIVSMCFAERLLQLLCGFKAKRVQYPWMMLHICFVRLISVLPLHYLHEQWGKITRSIGKSQNKTFQMNPKLVFSQNFENQRNFCTCEVTMS